MEKNKRKALSSLYEDMLRIRRRPPDPKAVERFNELRRKDEEMERQKKEDESKKKRIALPTEASQ